MAEVPNWAAAVAFGLNAYAGIAMVATRPAAKVITAMLMMLRLVLLREAFFAPAFSTAVEAGAALTATARVLLGCLIAFAGLVGLAAAARSERRVTTS
jgi:hypothetical protein